MKLFPILLLILLTSGCVSDGGKWQYATVVSKTHESGTLFLESSSEVIVFNDEAGNIYILTEYYQTPFQSSDVAFLEINKTYLVHVDGNGYVDSVDLDSGV